MAPGRSFTLPGVSCKTVVKTYMYCLAVSRCRQAVSLLHLMLALCRQALPVDIFYLLLAIPGHSFVWIFGTKLPIYK